MQKKFFLISQVFYPDEVSTAGLFTNLCEHIAEQDVQVEVWCAQPSYNTRKRQQKRVYYKGINIFYLASSNFSKSSTFGRLVNYLTFSLSLLFKLLFTKDKTPLFTSTNPPFLGFVIAVITSIKHRKFNYIVQDVFPDGLIKLNKLKENTLFTKLWQRMNRFTLKKANSIIVIGRDMNIWIENTYRPAVAKTAYIPIWQDGKLLTPITHEQNTFIKEHELENQFIVQYSGNMGLWNDMKTFGLVANKLNNKELTFAFIGDGMRLSELKESLNDNTKRNVRFFPFQAKKNLAQSLTACHIALVSLNTGLEGIAVPSKIMGIMAAGIPVVALVPAQSEIALLIEENKCGVVIEPEDVSACAQAILNLKADDNTRKEMGINARKAFINKYSTDIISSRYIQLLS